MVNPSPSDQVFYSLEPDYAKQRREVREFWDRYRDRRRADEAAKRALVLARAAAALRPLRPIAGIVGAILFGASLLYLAGFIRGIFG
jgi:hypothetical protein